MVLPGELFRKLRPRMLKNRSRLSLWACSSLGEHLLCKLDRAIQSLQSLECRPAHGASNPFEFTAVHS
jgi:hypothetical protein